MHSRMVAAQLGVNRRLKELRIPVNPSVVAGMFAAITAAAGSYGCEVWSTHLLGAWHLHADQCKLQSYQAAVYKQSLGVPRSTANLLTFFEMGRSGDGEIRCVRCVRCEVREIRCRCRRYWNKLAGLGQQGPSLLTNTFVANVAAGVTAAAPTPGPQSCAQLCSLCARNRTGLHTCCSASPSTSSR